MSGASSNEPGPGSNNGDGGPEQELPMKDVTDPHEADVLCGRGGAALRHPGNQTYRRLVNLNKGLYITCLKTEKLKISRSIVAAIREQRGRFLERNASKGTWFDIGDKKAIEKTSQALREGQPKLRQKIVEMGGGATGTAALMEQQFNANGLSPATMGFGMGNMAPLDPSYLHNPAMTNHSHPMDHHPLNHHHQEPSALLGSNHRQPEMMHPGQAMGHHADMPPPSLPQDMGHQTDMPPPPSRPDIGSDMLQRLSLQENTSNSSHHRNSSNGNSNDMNLRSKLRPTLSTRGTQADTDLGVPESSLSLLSDFSAVGSGIINESGMLSSETSSHSLGRSLGRSIDGSERMASFSGHSNSYHHYDGSSSSKPPSAYASIDRRRMFAKMKYSRPASGRFQKPAGSQHSLDGMPEIHMVESNMSMYSGLSSVDSKTAANLGDPFTTTMPTKTVDGRGPTFPSEYVGVAESRRSIMSGLSRISDTSEMNNSIFSDLSKKIGNVSTRSIAMSEISGMEDIGEVDDSSENDGLM